MNIFRYLTSIVLSYSFNTNHISSILSFYAFIGFNPFLIPLTYFVFDFITINNVYFTLFVSCILLIEDYKHLTLTYFIDPLYWIRIVLYLIVRTWVLYVFVHYIGINRLYPIVIHLFLYIFGHKSLHVRLLDRMLLSAFIYTVFTRAKDLKYFTT